ncbi:MAG: tetratricopeptide repeat protein [Myxococcales bacterium]|nr:tetratricopeptide repeat protein [Myxococcales bacterium]
MSGLPPECQTLPAELQTNLTEFLYRRLPAVRWMSGAGDRRRAAVALKTYLKRLQYFGVYETDEIQWVDDLEAAKVAHQASVRSASLDESRELALKSIQTSAEACGRLPALHALRGLVRQIVSQQQPSFFSPQDCANAADDVSMTVAWMVVSDQQLEPNPFDPLLQLWEEGFWPIGPLAGKFVLFAPSTAALQAKMAQYSQGASGNYAAGQFAPQPSGQFSPQPSGTQMTPSGDGWTISMSWSSDQLEATNAAAPPSQVQMGGGYGYGQSPQAPASSPYQHHEEAMVTQAQPGFQSTPSGAYAQGPMQGGYAPPSQPPMQQQQPMQQQMQQPMQQAPMQMAHVHDPDPFVDAEIAMPQSSGKGMLFGIVALLAVLGGAGWFFLLYESTEQVYQKAVRQLKMKNYAKAQMLLERILKEDKEFTRAHRALADAYFGMDKKHAAIDAYKKAITFNSSDALAQRNLGYLLKQQFDFQDAEIALQQAAQKLSNDPLVWLYLGDVQAAMKRYTSAEQSYKRAIANKADLATAWNNLGTVYLQQAQTLLTTATALNPDMLKPTKGKEGPQLPPQVLSQLQQAESAFQKAIQSGPKALYHRNLGNALAMQGKEDMAIQAYLAAQQSDASKIEPTVNLAALMIRQYRYAEALPYLQRAIPVLTQKAREFPKITSYKQELAATYYNLGLAHEGMGSREEAVKAYQSYTQEAPQDADGFCRLGQVLKALRQKPQAKQAYETCLRLNPSDKDARRVLRSLR